MRRKTAKLRAWTKDDVRTLKALVREKTKTTVIARKLKADLCRDAAEGIDTWCDARRRSKKEGVMGGDYSRCGQRRGDGRDADQFVVGLRRSSRSRLTISSSIRSRSACSSCGTQSSSSSIAPLYREPRRTAGRRHSRTGADRGAREISVKWGRPFWEPTRRAAYNSTVSGSRAVLQNERTLTVRRSSSTV
jgi:hypothetical protein